MLAFPFDPIIDLTFPESTSSRRQEPMHPLTKTHMYPGIDHGTVSFSEPLEHPLVFSTEKTPLGVSLIA